MRGFFAALNAKDAAALSAIVQPDFTWTMMLSEPPTGYRAVGIDEVVAQFFKGGDGVFRAGDPKSTITAIVTHGDRPALFPISIKPEGSFLTGSRALRRISLLIGFWIA